jgi:hypothetical protein
MQVAGANHFRYPSIIGGEQAERRCFMVAQLMLLALFQADSPAVFEPWEVPGVQVVDDTPEVFLVTREHRRDCPKLGSVCMSPGGSATLVGVEVSDSRPAVTVLARGAQVAAKGGVGIGAAEQPWQAEMVARFKSKSEQGPIIVALFDRDDQESILANEAKAIWTVNMEPGRDLGMRFLLSPADGFEPSHTYLVRVVQEIGQTVHDLADGEVHLE